MLTTKHGNIVCITITAVIVMIVILEHGGRGVWTLTFELGDGPSLYK